MSCTSTSAMDYSVRVKSNKNIAARFERVVGLVVRIFLGILFDDAVRHLKTNPVTRHFKEDIHP